MDSYIHMKLYTLTKRQFLFLFFIFFSSFILSLFIGWVGPSVIETVRADKGVLSDNNHVSVLSPIVSTSQQQMWLQLEINLGAPASQKTIQKVSILQVPMKVTLYKYSEGEKTPLTFNTTWHTRELKCDSERCAPVTVLHLGYLQFDRYFVDIETSKDLVNTSVFKPVWTTYNPHFTQLELWFRFFFLIAAFIAACCLGRSMRHFVLQDWAIEQKWLAVLLILVLLYDNPLFPMMLLVGSTVIPMLDACFTVTFLCGLLLFWLCAYHGIRKAERHFLSFYLLKVCLVGTLWFLGCVILSWSAYNEMIDPTFNISQDQEGFLGVKIFFFVVLGIYILYLLFLLIRAFNELHSMPYFDVRLRFLTTLTVIILIISLLAVLIRFGKAMIEDSFVMEITLRWNNSAEFLCFYSLFNFYLFTLAFVYSPSKNAIYESYKENPSFSMLSDSEEEVLYGGKKFMYDEDEESM